MALTADPKQQKARWNNFVTEWQLFALVWTQQFGDVASARC